MFSQKKKRHEELEKKLLNYSRQYYIFDDPSVTDAEYDALYNELLAIEEEYPQLRTEKSPSQNVGAPIPNDVRKVEHKIKMLSLENAYNESDILNFINRIKKLTNRQNVDFYLEPKLDGLSASIVYKDGVLVQASTRGAGAIGEDVTENMKVIDNVPKTIDDNGEVEIRGEVVMLKKDFEQLNSKREADGDKLFANPRNAAAGSLRQLDSNITSARNLKFFAYALLGQNVLTTTQEETMSQLRNYGFTTTDKNKLCHSYEEIQAFCQEMESVRADLDYDIDGVVFKTNEFRLQDFLGFAAKYPKHSIAYKFPAQKAETTILDIVVQVGRTGNITPVAELKPVNIGGVVVSRATLHNKDEIEKKDIRIGDRVIIQRAGDVIPQILRPIPAKRSDDSRPFVFPSFCPCCGSPLVRREDEVAIKCENINCTAQLVERLIHFASRPAFNIDGLGEKNIEFLFRRGMVKSPVDIFYLEKKNHIYHLDHEEGWGMKSVGNLFKSIESSRKITLDRLIYSLGIPQVGRTASKLFAKFYKNFDNFVHDVETNDFDRLRNISGIGPTITNEVRSFFAIPSNIDVLKKLASLVTIVDAERGYFDSLKNPEIVRSDESRNAAVSQEFVGKYVVFTGTLTSMSRNSAMELVESRGGTTGNSVSSKTSLVVAGANAGSKLERARALGLKIISEDEFLKIIK